MPAMKIWSMDSEKDNRKSPKQFYIGAVFLGLLLFIIFLAVFKGVTFLLIMIIKYWIFILGGFIGLLFLKKIFSKKRDRIIVVEK